MIPAYRIVGDPRAPRWAFVLHGILGSQRNWFTVARQLVSALPDLAVVTVDLRCHGKSSSGAPPHTVPACAQDLRQLAEFLEQQPAVVIGHSFGAKVALAYADQAPRGLERVWVLDALPGPVPHPIIDVDRVIARVREVVTPLVHRDELVDQLVAAGLTTGLAQWMATNLRPGEGGLVWTFDLDGIEALLSDYKARDYWPLLERAGGPRIEVVRALDSNLWTPHSVARLRRLAASGRVGFHELADAGHWLHADNLSGLLGILTAGWADPG